ncbi:citrate transporter [Sphingobium sp. SCG-1]|uniref:CitMHS family transporter n=1 Tax=Sphingobium sp. SCG-1 TaxID=2072936 RepID=UPI000CD68CE8|nr:citrate:proton symporter [Sphingobium sp. SCG-1]AUW56997.1 citrate transporter [Sphingobium sp. SCG-1]
MLMLLGYLMVLTFMIMIMTKRLSALVALTIIPVIFGLLAGHGADIGAMAVEGISNLAPTATLLLFAVLYFAVMIDAGLFDPLVNRVLKFAGDDPVRVSLGTAILALVVSLDGDGATTALITITAFLPVYHRLGMNPLVLSVNLGSAACVMNLTPWGGPLGRAAAALHVNPSDIFIPLLPTLAAGIAGTLLVSWHLGRRERSRIAVEGTGRHSHNKGLIFERDEALLRPKMFFLNLVLTLMILGAAISGILPLPLLFMIGLSVALLLNYPSVSQQSARIKAHAENGLPIVLLILAAGSFTGVMQGTGMIDAMAKGAVTLVPPALGPWMGVATAFLAMPLTFVLSNDAFYFGVVPVIAETASHYQIEAVVIGRASLLALPIHGLSPLIAAIYLIASLLGRDVGAMQRFGLKWAILLSLVLIGAATLTGVII